MKRKRCISCGSVIVKSASQDPYICRKCENEHGVELERYKYLDVS